MRAAVASSQKAADGFGFGRLGIGTWEGIILFLQVGRDSGDLKK